MSTTAEAVPNPGRVENLALVFQEVLTAIVRLRANRQELSDAESFRFQIREALKAAVQEARNRALLQSRRHQNGHPGARRLSR